MRAGSTVVLTRSRDDNAALAARLQAAGIAVIEAPTAELRDVTPEPWVQDALLEASAVAFTSRHGVESALRQLGRAALVAARQSGVVIAAVGEATADVLRHACVGVDVVGTKDGAALAHLLARQLEGDARPVLALQARHGRPELADGLRAQGFRVQVAVLYENAEPPPPSADVLAACARADAIYAAAPSAGERLLAWAPHLANRRWVAIGSTTAAALRPLGVTPAAIAAAPDDASVLTALLELP